MEIYKKRVNYDCNRVTQQIRGTRRKMKFFCLECDSTFNNFEDWFNHGIRMNHEIIITGGIEK